MLYFGNQNDIAKVCSCTAADKKASVYANSSDAVSTTSDTKNKECTFSVNNAAVSSTLVLKDDVDSIIWYRQVWMHSNVNADTFL
jgi:hypothetical protein